MTACPNCGGEIRATAKFCRHCRYDLQVPSPLPPWSDEDAEPEAVPEALPRRRSLKVLLIVGLVILAVIFCILAGLALSKALQSRVGAVLQNPTVESGPANTVQPVVMVVPTAVSQGQLATVVPVLPPTVSSPVLPSTSQYDIVVAGGTVHPNGGISYSSSQTCMGGCGSYSGVLELQGIRIVDQGFTLGLQIRISENSGDPWLFGANFGDTIVLEINGQVFKPAASSFPTQVTSPGLMSGSLSFAGQIPLSVDGQNKVTLTINNRMQPVEGWLLPAVP